MDTAKDEIPRYRGFKSPQFIPSRWHFETDHSSISISDLPQALRTFPSSAMALSKKLVEACIPAYACPEGTKMHLLNLGTLNVDEGW